MGMPNGRAVVLSWSGGKDSSLALQALRADPDLEVVALLTSVTAGYDRVSIHGVRRTLLVAQAASLGLPLVEITLRPQCSNAEYEAAFREGLAAIRARFPTVTEIAFGDLFLEDVRAYREHALHGSGFAPRFPLWGTPTPALAARFVADGFVAHLVCVDTAQLDQAFAGRRFDNALLSALPPLIDPCGERGEFHTFVSDGPIFDRKIDCALGPVVIRDDRFAYCDLLGPDDR
ncbi:ATP-binding protein [Gemmatimonas sp.]|uniref:Dph6-related ATP pyrophosphatase n=1 Tax=Gemmatimonas sp. TaxID=1962908 RepID=UPI003983C01E